jgi:hypothetical protein
MLGNTENLADAAENGEHGTIQQAGWTPVYQALRDWWPKRFDLPAFASYLQVFNPTDTPERAMVALREFRGESWRPSPTNLYARMHPPAEKQRHGQKLRKDQLPEALAEVRRRIETGEQQVCDCPTRPFEVRVDQHHVLTCTRCDGIEQGQAYEAEDEELNPSASAYDSPISESPPSTRSMP